MPIILEREFGHFRLDMNPMVEKKTSGSKVDEGLEFIYTVGLYYRKSGVFNPVLNSMGKWGSLVIFFPRINSGIKFFRLSASGLDLDFTGI